MFSYSFSKDSRLRNQKEISSIFKEGTFKRLGLIGIKFIPTERDYSRFLISINKSFGNSPNRNRMKRILKEAIRLNKNILQRNFDICFFVKKRPQKLVTFGYVDQKISKVFSDMNQSSKSSKIL